MFSPSSWIISLFFVHLVVIGTDASVVSKVKLRNNAYSGLVIAIKPGISDNQALVESIKNSFTKASAALFIASKKRAYFGQITILVPKYWTGTYAEATLESYAISDVLIASENPRYGNAPYTLQFGRCGYPGSFIHFTPEYMLNDKYKNKEKAIVHNWARYRWGVYDEIAKEGYPDFYLDKNVVEANRCPVSLKGAVGKIEKNNQIPQPCNYSRETLLPVDECRFYPSSQQQSELKTSMMSYYDLSQVTTFCHSDPAEPTNMHNAAAPNEQNRLCDLRSTWDVILDSEDFSNNSNPENPSIIDTTPTFNIVQAVPERYVLVLDVSGSMARMNRLTTLRKATNYFLENFIPDDVYVGMVEFSTQPNILSELVLISKNNANRQSLINAIPDRTIKYTGIGRAILKGIEVLNRGGYPTCGSNLIVLTDGKETESLKPLVSEVFVDVLNNTQCIKLHAISLDLTNNTVNDALNELAIASGGKWFLAHSTADPTSLNNIFQEISKLEDGKDDSKSIQILSDSIALEENVESTGQIWIDDTVGNETVIACSWNGAKEPKVSIKSPTADCYYASYNNKKLNLCADNPIHTIDMDFKVLKFNIPGICESGEWIYYITTTETTETVIITVTARAVYVDVAPVEIVSGLLETEVQDGQPASLYAKVSQGFHPVLDAHVCAFITRPDLVTVNITLLDNGASPDVLKNDGIYSSYFTNYSIDAGRYVIKFIASKNSTSTSETASSGGFTVVSPGLAYPNGTVITNEDSEEIKTAIKAANVTVFRRTSTGQSFSYSGTSGPDDKFPPSKVIDLRINQKDLKNSSSGIECKFTAPGDDFNSGTAYRYEIRYCIGDPMQLLTNFTNNPKVSVITGDLNSPKTSSESESFVIGLPNPPQNESVVQVAVALRGDDEVGNSATISNVATISYYLKADALPTVAATTPVSTTTETAAATTTPIPTTKTEPVTTTLEPVTTTLARTTEAATTSTVEDTTTEVTTTTTTTAAKTTPTTQPATTTTTTESTSAQTSEVCIQDLTELRMYQLLTIIFASLAFLLALLTCLLLGLCLGCRKKKKEKKDKADEEEDKEDLDYANSLSSPPAYSFYGMQGITAEQKTLRRETKKNTSKRYEEIENVYENIRIDA